MAKNNEYDQNMERSPMRIFSAVRKAQAFSIEAALSPAGAGSDSLQPVMLHSKFSRFMLAIWKDGSFTTANISVPELPWIILRSEEAIRRSVNEEIDTCIQETGDTSNTPAYTQKLLVGKGKGKTPVQFLMGKGPDGIDAQSDILNSTWQWLKNNTGGNPEFDKKNIAQMRAIEEAAALLKEGKLKFQKRYESFTIYDSGFRPLVNRKMKDGKNFVYEYTIQWMFGENSPARIQIKNYYAIVDRQEDGKQIVHSKTAQDCITHSVNLTAGEWEWAIHMMRSTMRYFEDEHGPEAYRISSAAAEANIEKARQSR